MIILFDNHTTGRDFVHVGTVNPDGTSITGGDILVTDGANFTVSGSLLSINGNIDASAGGTLTVNAQPPSDANLIVPGSYTIIWWREVRN